eukprot:7129697-Alexandrium_andersonii.AAC.1
MLSHRVRPTDYGPCTDYGLLPDQVFDLIVGLPVILGAQQMCSRPIVVCRAIGPSLRGNQ